MPGVFGKVNSVIDWIKDTITHENECLIKGDTISVYFKNKNQFIYLRSPKLGVEKFYITVDENETSFYESKNGLKLKYLKLKNKIKVSSRKINFSCEVKKYKFEE